TCSPTISTNMWPPELMKILLANMRKIPQSLAALCLSTLLLIGSVGLKADEVVLPAIDSTLVKLSIIEAKRDSGYTVLDLIPSFTTIDVKKPFKLLDTSLPLVGYRTRYKRQITGIESPDNKKVEAKKSHRTVYATHQPYPIFPRKLYAKPHSASPEYV